MTIFLVTLLPCIVFIYMLIREIAMQKKFVLLFLVIWCSMASLYYAVAVAHLINTGVHLFPFSFFINRFFASSVLPLVYLIGNRVMGRRVNKVSYFMLALPTLVLMLLSLLPGSVVPGKDMGDVMPYYPTVLITINEGVKFGWTLVELVIVIEGMWLVIQSINDYYTFGDSNHRTDAINNLIRYYALIGFTYQMHALVGCQNWMLHRDCAVADFCFNTFVVCLGMHLMRNVLVERRGRPEFVDATTDFEADLLAVPMDKAERESAIEEIERETQKAKSAMPPAIDFAVVPEIPRPEQTASSSVSVGRMDVFDISKEDIPVEPTQKDLLVIALRKLVDKDKVYLEAGIRIDDVALRLGTNRTYLSRMMKDTYGHSFAEYMNICRLKSAQIDMLQRKDASIESIALANGFNSSNTFNKVFNQFYECSPAQWRRNNSNSPS